MDWLRAAIETVGRGETCVLVTVARTRGSAPREAGAKMLVWSDGTAGTIGGGHLELRATADALAMRRDGAPIVRVAEFSLGPQLAQCCGGSATLLFERLSAEAAAWLQTWAEMISTGIDGAVVTDLCGGAKTFVGAQSSPRATLPAAVAEHLPVLDRTRCLLLVSPGTTQRYLMEAIRPAMDHLYLFGAGHVGRAVARAIAPLGFRVTWIDSRDDALPADLPPGVVARRSDTPPRDVDQAPRGTYFLVMTHSHPLDLEICARVLRRDDFAYLGLIGSETKRARFASRLRAIGVPPAALTRLTCPIGIPGIASKEPAAIAASVAAQLLIVAERRRYAGRRPLVVAAGSGG
ncbi:MAG: xanthine dehydrogenase accessory protein XdhC [Dongiaceae bacterium]